MMYSYNTLILNQDNLKIIVESLMDRRFDNIVFVDKPRGDNSFDLVIVITIQMQDSLTLLNRMNG